MTHVKFGYGTDVGRVRDHNEDNLLAEPELGLWVVADGMGGAASGEVASAIVIEHIVGAVRAGHTLSQATGDAHHAVRNGVKTGRGNEGMGSTGVALQLTGETYDVTWVGDSRAYLWNGVQLRQISRDHSFVQQLIDAGAINEEEALAHPNRNIIYQCLGASQLDDVQVDSVHGRFYREEQILLCSDGLTGEVSDADIASILAQGLSEQETVNTLIQQACDNGGSDNVTAILVSASEDAPTQTKGSDTLTFNSDELNRKTLRKHRLKLTTGIIAGLLACGLTLAAGYWLIVDDEPDVKPGGGGSTLSVKHHEVSDNSLEKDPETIIEKELSSSSLFSIDNTVDESESSE